MSSRRTGDRERMSVSLVGVVFAVGVPPLLNTIALQGLRRLVPDLGLAGLGPALIPVTGRALSCSPSRMPACGRLAFGASW